jgi:hypothetical protein
VLALSAGTAKMRPMSARALAITSRLIFFACGAASLLTSAPYAILRGAGLPYEREWIIFFLMLAVLGLFGVATAVLPRSWLARASRQDGDRMFSLPLKLVGIFAVVFYLVAVVGNFAPHSWNLDPQIMFSLCPMYLIKMSFDPPATTVFFILAPLNAGTYGALGLLLGYLWLFFQGRR